MIEVVVATLREAGHPLDRAELHRRVIAALGKPYSRNSFSNQLSRSAAMGRIRKIGVRLIGLPD